MQNNENEIKIGIYKRICPACSKEISHKDKYAYLKGLNKNKICVYCSRQQTGLNNKGNKRTEEFKENLRIKMTNHPSIVGNKQRGDKISLRLKEIDHSYLWKDYIKEKIICIVCNEEVNSQKSRLDVHKFCSRKCQTKYYRNNGVWIPRFNPIACNIIEEYGKQNGYNFQHALNGGEFWIKQLNYWVDGYDKEQNVVIEYNEKHHNHPQQKENDIKRKKEIIKILKCKFIILHYNNIIETYE